MTPFHSGVVFPIQILVVDPNGNRITGLSSGTLVADIRCTTPGGANVNKFWDFGGGGFKSSGWTTRRASLAEVDAVNAPGYYALSAGWDTTGLALGTYVVTYDLTAAVDTTSVPASDDVLITADPLSTDISGATDPKTLAGALTCVRRWTTWTPGTPNVKKFDLTGSPEFIVYADDGTTVLYTVPLTGVGGSVAPANGEVNRVG